MLALAAASAASPSGSKTIAAIMTPTTAFGAPTRATALSKLGASFFASNTTAIKQAMSKAALNTVAALPGTAACAADSLGNSSCRKICRCPMVCVKTKAP